LNSEVNFACPDDTTIINVPANTYFSTISQEDADAQAEAFAESECPVIPPEFCDGFNTSVSALTWATYGTPNGDGAGTGAGGDLTFSGTEDFWFNPCSYNQISDDICLENGDKIRFTYHIVASGITNTAWNFFVQLNPDEFGPQDIRFGGNGTFDGVMDLTANISDHSTHLMAGFLLNGSDTPAAFSCTCTITRI
jgi:hypothetical protein